MVGLRTDSCMSVLQRVNRDAAREVCNALPCSRLESVLYRLTEANVYSSASGQLPFFRPLFQFLVNNRAMLVTECIHI